MSTQRPIVNLQSDVSLASPADAGLPVSAHRLAFEGSPAPQGWRLTQLLSPQEVQVLREQGMDACSQPVGIDGILGHYQPGSAIGSWRASFFSEELSLRLWSRLKGLDFHRTFSEQGHADWQGHSTWEAVGVNSLFRFILYKPGEGELVAHYDAPYVANSELSSLYTLLLYLTDAQDEGATRFLHDEQQCLPFSQRDFSDWSRCALPEEVAFTSMPQAGDALVFEHRLLHDSQPVTRQSKLVMRSDVMFRKVR